MPNSQRGIKTYRPQIRVTLFKVSQYKGGQSTRYAGSPTQIDLTPYLGDLGYCSTFKDVRQPAGSFTIALSNKADPTIQDSVYALVAPMDYVEIRMAHDPAQYPDGEWPIVMRGFVCKIASSQRMGDDGRPVRMLLIQGQDYAKLLGQMQVFYGVAYELGKNILLTVFKVTQGEGISFVTFTPNGFMQEVLDKVVQPALDKMWHDSALAGSKANPWRIALEGSVQEGTVLPYGMQPYQGSILGLLKEYSDIYWNELFVRDDKDGAKLVYRPIPFKGLDGKWLNGATDPGGTKITLSDVVSADLARSDTGVANYFFVLAPQFLLNSAQSAILASLSNQGQFILSGINAANCNPDLYGLRRMQVNSNQGSGGQRDSGTGQDKETQLTDDAQLNDWMSQRRQELVALNRDNVLYEEGELEIKGNELAVPGTYLTVDYGAYTGDYYMAAVSQVFAPFQGYTTRVSVVRGTGYINRTVAPKSPYNAERSVGAMGSGS